MIKPQTTYQGVQFAYFRYPQNFDFLKTFPAGNDIILSAMLPLLISSSMGLGQGNVLLMFALKTTFIPIL